MGRFRKRKSGRPPTVVADSGLRGPESGGMMGDRGFDHCSLERRWSPHRFQSCIRVFVLPPGLRWGASDHGHFTASRSPNNDTQTTR